MKLIQRSGCVAAPAQCTANVKEGTVQTDRVAVGLHLAGARRTGAKCALARCPELLEPSQERGWWAELV